MKVVTINFMQAKYAPERNEETSPAPGSDTSGSDEAFRRFVNPRVQFLRITAFSKTRTESLGETPPFCPLGPTLSRSPYLESTDESGRPRHRRSNSPLQHLLLSNYSITANSRMPHSTNMPHSGFQALVLCGPGIGLSTFTSVPSEYPKALINVANRPMVWYVLDWCYRMGVTDITLVTPPASKVAIAAALAQNPYLTSLPSPTPNLLAPRELDHTTPTAELLRLPEVQAAINSDFLLLPCDLLCDVPGETFLESYLTSLGGLGGAGTVSTSDLDGLTPKMAGLGGERTGRRGGLSVWFNTANREESVKGEECDFMGTTKLDPEHNAPLSKPSTNDDQPKGTLRKLVWTIPMSELQEQCEEDKSWRIRQSLLSKYGSLKCLTKFRDSHIYLFPYWVKDFAKFNEDFESVSEDLVGTWAKSDWRKPSYRARFGARKVLGRQKEKANGASSGISIEDEIDLLSLSSTQTTRHKTPVTLPKKSAQLASRVQADPDDSILSPDRGSDDETDTPPPLFPPILSYIHSSSPTAPLIRRIDMTPLLLSTSLLLAKIPSLDDPSSAKQASPFAHPSKVAATVSIAQRVTISRSDSLIDSNTSVATQCVIKTSVIGSSVSIGTGARLTNCLIMDGAVIGDKCVLTGTVVGKKANVGKNCVLQGCEVQDGNAIGDGTEGKGEKYLIGGLEDEFDEEDGFDDDLGEGDGEGFDLGV